MRPMGSTETTDETDEHDRLLLREGRHAELLARYYSDIRTHVAIRLGPGQRVHREEVAHRVVDRLARELGGGRVYRVPFRVVVHQISGWAVAEWFSELARAREFDGGALEDLEATGWAVAPDDYAGVDLGVTLEAALGDLPPGDREVATLRWLESLEPSEIAERLGRSRNAVDQALHRARVFLKAVFDRGR
jgi:DNA-directed RNA polymerase specialized sigma24 family protein